MLGTGLSVAAVSRAIAGPDRPNWVPAGALAHWDFALDRSWRAGVVGAGVDGVTEGRTSTGWDHAADGALVAFAASVPRRTAAGLRIEPARTNLVTRSSDFRNTADAGGSRPWSYVNATLAAGAVSKPGGLADRLAENAASGAHGIELVAPVVAGPVTTSALLKFAGRKWVYLTHYNAASPGTDEGWFDLEAGVQGTQQANVVTTMRLIVDGWYLVTATFMALAGNLTFGVRGASGNGATANYVGSNGPAFGLWHAQIEQGAAVSTPILTAGGSVARVADAPRLAIANGTYQLKVFDGAGNETRLAQVASGGTGLALTPRAGQTLVTKAEIYPS
jgi:hypothetical protein